MKKYYAVWGSWQKHYPNSTDNLHRFITESFFTEERGYSPEENAKINDLGVGNKWDCPDGNHFVVRMPDDFVADFIHYSNEGSDESEWHQVSNEKAIKDGYVELEEVSTEGDNVCIAVWLQKEKAETPSREYSFWIVELENGKFYTVAGRTSELGSFDECVKCLNNEFN
jgi:hypothetical protein